LKKSNMKPQPNQDTAALSQRVYDDLKKMIVSGDLIPGNRLNQKELADKLGVSRTPLLAAFNKLIQENLLESTPNRGVYVKQLSLMEIADLYDIRLQLEPLGAQKAAEHVDGQMIQELSNILNEYEEAVKIDNVLRIIQLDALFHSSIMKFSKNSFLYNMVVNFDIIMVSNRIGLLNEHHKSLEEHKALLVAISDGNTEKAKTIMHNHIKDARQNLLHRLSVLNMTYIKM